MPSDRDIEIIRRRIKVIQDDVAQIRGYLLQLGQPSTEALAALPDDDFERLAVLTRRSQGYASWLADDLDEMTMAVNS